MHACVVSCQGEQFWWYLGRITRTVPGLIDVVQSSFMTLTDGHRLLKKAVYQEGHGAEFFLARDAEFHRFVASEALKALVAANGLRVGFVPV